jgi:hypothetical protein
MIAYLILAHRSPSLVRRLISRLASPESCFFVHVDRKSEFGPFRWVLDEFNDKQLRLYQKIDTRWGEYSLVEATLFLLREAQRHAPHAHRYILLSGQSYPIKPRSSIETIFEEAHQASYIEADVLPDRLRHRVDRHYFSVRGWQRVYPPFQAPTTSRERLLNSIFKAIFKMPRSFPRSLTPHYGSQWWCLSRRAAEYVTDFVEQRPDFVRFQRHSHVPDEMFFQTILSSGPEDIVGGLVNRDLNFTIWEGDDQPSPAVLGARHFERLRASDCLFARKFEFTTETEILDRIDRDLLGVS